MKFIDLSHPLANGAEAFPNDPKMAIIAHGRVRRHRAAAGDAG